METNSTTQFTIQEASSAGAVKSGGPNTNRGKARSRRNAVKHGIFAKVVLLEHEPSAQGGFPSGGNRGRGSRGKTCFIDMEISSNVGC
jgi:hypothetical protein